MVTISADGPLNQALTSQDADGFHVVVPNASAHESPGTDGIRVRQVGKSIEVVLQTKPGANVAVRHATYQLTLSFEGKLEPRAFNSDTSEPKATEGSVSPQTAGVASKANSTKSPETRKPTLPSSSGPLAFVDDNDGFLAAVFSGTSFLVFVALGLVGLLASRKASSRNGPPIPIEIGTVKEKAATSVDVRKPHIKNSDQHVSVKTSATATAPYQESKSPNKASGSVQPTVYGAFLINQEVNKLILGQPHRVDVLSSRAANDRSAIETSLVKIATSTSFDETVRTRAQDALQEYGFVARQCASLLMAKDPLERASAARFLGAIRSATSLQYLLEALYDADAAVRNQAVVSVGKLQVPAAIGALLDIAQRHPDIPGPLVRRALTACSVEGLNQFDMPVAEPVSPSVDVMRLVNELRRVETTKAVDDLPATSSDERCIEALSDSESHDDEQRFWAIKTLAEFRVQPSVAALSRIARSDFEPNMRALGIASLAAIGHESVFPGIVIGMADDSREVRAAAARALSHLSFERADAYMRLSTSTDEKLLHDVATACCEAEIVSQNIDRLSSLEARQAYEAFALICVLARAKQTEPVLEAIASHENSDVRKVLVQMLASTGAPEVVQQLNELASSNKLPEDIRMGLFEAVRSVEQSSSSNSHADKNELGPDLSQGHSDEGADVVLH